jgi:Raf kinase inhibitor-like YbhB/YbcL family protein
MKLTRHSFALTALGAAAVALAALGVQTASAQGMTVTSAEISDGAVSKTEQEANVFGCKGANISPSLKWAGVPDGTKSFAINLYDPDAPTGPPPDGRRGFWHWIVFNIPVSTTSLPAEAGNVKIDLMPKGTIQARNDYGFWGYGGMCPPEGDQPHHYTLTVYAVDEDKLQFAKDNQVPAPVVGYELHFHSKGIAQLRWTFGR